MPYSYRVDDEYWDVCFRRYGTYGYRVVLVHHGKPDKHIGIIISSTCGGWDALPVSRHYTIEGPTKGPPGVDGFATRHAAAKYLLQAEGYVPFRGDEPEEVAIRQEVFEKMKSREPAVLEF